MKNFGVFCINCKEKSKCNLHIYAINKIIFTCFNCGKEEILESKRIEKTTKEQHILEEQKARDELSKIN